jgi:CofD-related protein of GAK system
MTRVQITQTITLPDPVKLARYQRAPELGPKILFFSGGSALRKTCFELIQYTHNSIHIITPFDSGGSSAKLRDAFQMPAIGDVRNRLLALAERSLHGYPEIYQLFAHRFPADGNPAAFEQEFAEMIKGRHPLVAAVPDPMRKIIRHHLELFKGFMPDGFDLRKASMGNLILAAGYLDNRRNFDVIIFIFSKLVQVRGIVRPVVNRYLHLTARLEDGRIIAGQHLLTGKETSPVSSPVKKVWLARDLKTLEPLRVPIRRKMDQLINDAELICYPMGSFYSSLIANLLPCGIGKSIARNPCPKIFIPNTGGKDPETYGIGLMDQVLDLISYLRADDPDHILPSDVLNFILVDRENGNYSGELDSRALAGMGIAVIDVQLVNSESFPYIDEKLLVPIILSLT